MIQAFQAPVAKSPEEDNDSVGAIVPNARKRGRPSATGDGTSPEAGNENGNARPRKPRPKRDPNQPKRPATAYLLYQNEMREVYKSKHPEMTNKELLQELSRVWHILPLEKKQPYQDRVDKNKEVYNEQMKAYDASKSANNTAGAQVAAPPNRPVAAAAAPAPKPAAKAVPPAPVAAPALQRPVPGTSESGGEETESSSESEGSAEEDDEDESESDEEEEVVELRPTKKHKSGPVPPTIAAAPMKDKKGSKK